MRGGEREKRQGEGERRIAGDGTNQDRSWREGGGAMEGEGTACKGYCWPNCNCIQPKVIESLGKNEAYYI